MKSEAPHGKPQGIFAELRRLALAKRFGGARSHNDEPAIADPGSAGGYAEARAMAGRLAIHPRGKPRGTLAKARSWLIPMLVVIVIGALSYGLTHWAVCNRCRPAPDRLEDVSFLSRELRLSDAQASEIAKLHGSLNAKLADCCQRHCAVRARLGQALRNETNGTVQARMIVEEMGRAYEASELATLNHIQRVRELLNPEQKGRFDELIMECVCGSCAMCGGRVEADPKVRSAN